MNYDGFDKNDDDDHDDDNDDYDYDVDAPPEVIEKRLSTKERHDVMATLDHLSAVGAERARTSDRLASTFPMSSEQDHLEDIRIYKKPKRRARRKWHCDDSDWDIDHGDTVHPVEFLNARLSSKRYKLRDSTDGPNLSIDTTECDVSPEEAPVALLNHCWQRAVHLASNPIRLDQREDQRDQAEADDENDQIKYSTKKALQLCETMKLDLSMNQLRCPNCDVDFDAYEKLHRHYYGLANQRGCCWILIDRKNHKLLDLALQAEVKAVAKQVCEILAKTVLQNGEPPQHLLTWFDVLSVFTSLLIKHNKGGATNTIQPDYLQTPISLNVNVIEAVHRRLHDRYSSLPK